LLAPVNGDAGDHTAVAAGDSGLYPPAPAAHAPAGAAGAVARSRIFEDDTRARLLAICRAVPRFVPGQLVVCLIRTTTAREKRR
jgi:hypothetical protein